MKTTWPRTVLFGMALLLAAAVAGAGEVTTVDGVPHIRNGATPAEGTVSWALQERWRIGGDDEDVLLGVILRADIDADDNVYLLDTQLRQVHILSSAGAYLRSIGSEGEGPGEVSFLADLVLLPDETIGLVQGFPAQIERHDSEGVPVGKLVPQDLDGKNGGFSSLSDVSYRGGVLALGGGVMQQKDGSFERVDFLGTYQPDGTPRARLVEKSSTPDFANFKFVEKDDYFVTRGGGWAIGPDGRVYAASYRDRYAIDVYNPDGSLERVIEREYEPWKRTEEEKERVGDGLLIVANGQQMDIEVHAEDHDPCIDELYVDDQNQLWVRSGHSDREQPAGTMLTYDVFDAEGHYLRQVAVQCDGDTEKDGLIHLAGNRFLLVRGLQDAARSMRGGRGGADVEEDEAQEDVLLEVVFYTVSG